MSTKTTEPRYVTVSKIFLVVFVGSVTLWYLVTPYIVQPHPRIVTDIVEKLDLTHVGSTLPGGKETAFVQIENWTKWRLYINPKNMDGVERKAQIPAEAVIYPQTKANVPLHNKMNMALEWRPEYNIAVETVDDDRFLDVQLETPFGSCSNLGIYNHLTTVVTGRTVKILPRFLFGLPFAKVQELYGKDAATLPITGVFTTSTKYDRVIIQAYMNVVTLSVIFLLWANNPPETLMSK